MLLQANILEDLLGNQLWESLSTVRSKTFLRKKDGFLILVVDAVTLEQSEFLFQNAGKINSCLYEILGEPAQIEIIYCANINSGCATCTSNCRLYPAACSTKTSLPVPAN